MSIKADRIKFLIDQFDRNQISEEEFSELFALIKENKNEAALKNILFRELKKEQSSEVDENRLNSILQTILQEQSNVIAVYGKGKRFSLMRVAAVAIIVLLGGGTYFWFNRSRQEE